MFYYRGLTPRIAMVVLVSKVYGGGNLYSLETSRDGSAAVCTELQTVCRCDEESAGREQKMSPQTRSSFKRTIYHSVNI